MRNIHSSFGRPQTPYKPKKESTSSLGGVYNSAGTTVSRGGRLRGRRDLKGVNFNRDITGRPVNQEKYTKKPTNNDRLATTQSTPSPPSPPVRPVRPQRRVPVSPPLPSRDMGYTPQPVNPPMPVTLFPTQPIQPTVPDASVREKQQRAMAQQAAAQQALVQQQVGQVPATLVTPPTPVRRVLPSGNPSWFI